MLELRIKQGSRHVPLQSLPARLGSRRARIEIGATVESLIAFLDELGGDPDLEDDRSDFEEGGDGLGDPSYCEWDTLTASTRRDGKLNAKPVDPNRGWLLEDEEQDDAPEEDDPLEDTGDSKDTNNAEDEVLASAAMHCARAGPGCEISDPSELTSAEGLYQGGARPPWDHDDDEPRRIPVAWPAERPDCFYRPPANAN